MGNAARSQLKPSNPGLQTQLPSLLHSTGSEPIGLQLQARDKRQTGSFHVKLILEPGGTAKIKGRSSYPSKEPFFALVDSHCVGLVSWLCLQAHSQHREVLGINHLAGLFGVCVWMKRYVNSPAFLVTLIYFPPLNCKSLGYSTDTLGLLTGRVTFLLGLQYARCRHLPAYYRWEIWAQRGWVICPRTCSKKRARMRTWKEPVLLSFCSAAFNIGNAVKQYLYSIKLIQQHCVTFCSRSWGYNSGWDTAQIEWFSGYSNFSDHKTLGITSEHMLLFASIFLCLPY